MQRMKRARGFTLVELLVVIGIIALLISILLPGLNAARRQANQAKCAASLRQLGNAYLLYANDNRGWYPPAKMNVTNTGTYATKYSLYDRDYPYVGYGGNTAHPYWYDFIGKYVTKNSAGYSATDNLMASDARRSVIWACPAWDGYTGSQIQDLGVFSQQMGIGPNDYANYSASVPALGTDYPPAAGCLVTTFDSRGVTAGGFVKQATMGKLGAMRMLFADTRFWICESLSPPLNGTFPPQVVPNNSITFTTGIAGQTMVDVYRHGKPPGPGPVTKTFATTGGKVAYNVLYCDGHVAGAIDQAEAYRSIRMRYPG